MRLAEPAALLTAAAVCASPLATGAEQGLLEDAELKLELRNFYINEDQRSGDPGYSRIEEWGQGAIAHFASGYTPGPVGFGVDVLGQYGVKLDGGGRAGKPDLTRQPGELFPLDDGEPVNEFGRLDVTGKLRALDTELRVGALEPDVPVVIRNDSRLLPQTFRGAQLRSEALSDFTIKAGELRRVSQRNSSDYEDMRVRGADAGSDRFRFAGFNYQPTQNITASYFAGELENFYLQHFLGLIHETETAVGTLETDLRLFHSDGHGSNAAGRAEYGATGVYASGDTTGEIDNRTASIKLSLAGAAHEVGIGYQRVYGNSDFPYIDNGDGSSVYLITYAQVGKFQRSGERTWLAEYSYDFEQAGIPGLSLSAAYLRAEHIRTLAGRTASEWERDVRLDYSPKHGVFSDFKLTLRHASLRSNFERQPDIDQARVVISYTLELN